MTTKEPLLPAKEIWSIAAPYFVAVGGCYLFGYWGAVGVNVLEFVGITDLAKLAIYPLLASIALFLIGTVTADLFLGNSLSPGGGSESRIGRLGRRFGRQILGALVLLITIVAIYGPEPMKWHIIAFTAPMFSVAQTHAPWAIKMVPNPRARSNLLYLVVLLPLLAFAYGRSNAHAAIHNRLSNQVDVTRSALPLTDDPAVPVLYLGLLGETHILYETKSQLLVFAKQRPEAPLFIRSSRSGA